MVERGTVLWWGDRLPARRLPDGRVEFLYNGSWRDEGPLTAQTFKSAEETSRGDG